MSRTYEKNETVEWLINKGIVESGYQIEDVQLLNCLSLCIDYYESITDGLINTESNYLLDESDIITPIYGDYNFNAKIGISPISKSDIVISIITALIKSSSTPEFHIILINIVSNLSKAFLSKMILLPNNSMRCIYLQLLISSNCTICPVSFDDIERSLKTGEDSDICPFLDFFTCDCLNKEVPNICSNKVPLKTILTDLEKLGIVKVDFDSKTVCLCDIME